MPEVSPTRKRLMEGLGLEAYQQWIRDPVTVEILTILTEESRVPATSMSADPNVGNMLYHRRAGIDWAIDVIRNINNTPSITEIDATFDTPPEQQEMNNG